MSDVKSEWIDKATKALVADELVLCRTHSAADDDDMGHLTCSLCHARARTHARLALEAVADDLRAEGAERALQEAADDLERRINEPGLILLADTYGGYHAGERARGQREADVLRARADEIAGEQR